MGEEGIPTTVDIHRCLYDHVLLTAPVMMFRVAGIQVLHHTSPLSLI